ncbi:MAG: bifunctional 4-hydroxy-2-oxoglutarate aldolase/2-dehydro-3-deoxy-phosphogluconate aldolase [Shewanella sp.]
MQQLIQQMSELQVIPVIAIEDAQDIIPLGKALYDNGLPVAEITFRSDAAVEAIALLRAAYPDMLIGAGTILTAEQAQAAKDAGATFAVSPGLNPNTVKACQAIDLPIIPGINNPSSIEQALELGLTALKFFPAEASGGVNMLKSLLGPFKQLSIMPSGGINANNINDYLKIDNVVACGSSWIVDSQLIANKNWDEIGRLTRTLVASLPTKALAA